MESNDSPPSLRARQHAGISALMALAGSAAATSPLPPIRMPATSRPVTAPEPPRISGRHRHGAVGGAGTERHLFRFLIFGAIGGGVFLTGLIMQMALVRNLHMNAVAAYVAQGVASIQASFLLNRYLTWRDRSIPFWRALWRFNTQKVAMTIVNMGAYALLIRLGVQYVVANVGLTAVFTPVNYLLGHYWSFTAVLQGQTAVPVASPLPPGPLPGTSAVIPCKNNPATICATVQALLAQDYPALAEVIVIGDIGDPTYAALDDVDDPRLIILEQEPTPGRRDPNVKRDRGICKASGDIIALVDSDIVMDPGWLSRAIGLLYAQDGGLVAGGMRSIHDTFWGRFVDRNALAAKTPRLDAPYYVTARNFGKRGFKPPITANAVFTRELYDACPLDTEWAYGYEDYEWFWRLAKAKHKILFSGELTAAHHHRRSFRGLLREYRRAAHGCGYYVRAHRDAPLARKRLRQACLLPLLAVAGAVSVLLAVVTGHAMDVGGVLVAAAALLAVREVVKTRSAEAVAYPAAGLILGVAFTASLVMSLSQQALGRSTSAPVTQYQAETDGGRSRRLWRGHTLAFTALLGTGAGLRFWQLAGKPGWQYDEGVYTRVAANLLQHGQIAEHITYSASTSPFLYQPPFYFEVLDRWFAILGPSIFHARILGVLCSLGTLTLLFLLLWHLHGPHAALYASAPIVLDGWLLAIQRVSYIENMLLLLMTAGMLLYQVALERGRPEWFAAAGAVLGFTAAFKYTGICALAAILLCWLIVRQWHRGHLVLLAAAVAVIGIYLLVMVKMYDSPGHDWFIQQTMVQVRRVLGMQSSGGTLTSPRKALHLLAAQYRVFVPSFLVAVAAFVIAIRRVGTCCRARNLAPLQDGALLFSWLSAGVVVFGLSSLRFPQYFALILVPMYAYFWTEVWRWRWRTGAVLALAAVAVAGGLGSFMLRIGTRDDNAFAQAQRYATTSVPLHAVVIADEAIGDLITQPYCREQDATPCLHVASYAVTWRTYLQSSFALGDPAFRELMRTARPMRSFTGFNGTVTFWKLGMPPSAAPVLGVDLYASRNYPSSQVKADGERNLVYMRHVLGAQSIGIVWNLYSASDASSQVKRNPHLSLSPAAVATLARQAQALGMSVEFRPLIRVGPRQGWEGHISPADQRAWFASLLRAELPYLRIAQRLHIQSFVAGTELHKLARSRYWPTLLARSRSVYHGTVTYASYQQEYVSAPQILPPTSVYGVDPYPNLNLSVSASVSQIVDAWDRFFHRVPAGVLADTAMQEVGIPAIKGAYRHPERWNMTGTPDQQVQVRWFSAACRVAAQYHMRGVYFYEVNLTDNPAHPLPFSAFFEGKRGARAIHGCLKIFNP